MSSLKIKDPAKRDAIVREYLELKKNIQGNLLSERTGELELKTNLSKFYRPITETQKATAREITEGLKPITETQKATAREITEGLKPIIKGIQRLPQAIKFHQFQSLERPPSILEEKPSFEEEEEEEEEPSGATPENLGDIAYHFIYGSPPYDIDETFGIYEGKDGFYRMGKQKNKGGDEIENKKKLTIVDNNILVEDEKFKGTKGLWELIMYKFPNENNYTENDLKEYKKLLIKTNAMNQDFD